MTDLLVLDLVDKGLVTDQIVLTVGYDIENLTDPARRAKYHGAVETDHYGRQIPKQAHGSINLDGHTSSTRKIMCAVSELFDRIVDKNLLVRRMYVVANHVLPETDAPKKNDGEMCIRDSVYPSGIFAARTPAEAGMLRTTNGQSVSWDSHPSEDRSEPVSYTHLDVYKRQPCSQCRCRR